MLRITRMIESLNLSEPARSRAAQGRTVGTAIALCLLLFAAGCVQRDDPGVEVASKESTIDYGLKIAKAPPPGLNAPGAVPPPVALPDQPKLDVKIPPAAPIPPVAGPGKKPPFCRTATRSDFPDQAPIGVSAPPKAGTWLY